MAGMASEPTTSLKRKMPDAAVDEIKASSSSTFLTHYVHVLAVLHSNSEPEKTLREVRNTEVAVLRITRHLEEDGFIEWERVE